MFEKHCQFHIIMQILEVLITNDFSLDLSFQSLKRVNGLHVVCRVPINFRSSLHSSITELRTGWRRIKGGNTDHNRCCVCARLRELIDPLFTWFL